MNDTPVACQIREPTDPQGDRCPRRGRMRCRRAAGYFAPRRKRFICLRRPHFFQQRKKWGERTPAETTFLHFLSALRLFAAVRFPSRNRRFPERCRSPDCASTAFRCRCLLLWQKLFVLLRHRLLYPVPNGHTYLCRRKAPKARFDNRQKRPAYQPLPSPLSAAAAQEAQAIPRIDNDPRRTSCASAYRQICMTHSAPRGP